jgi:hypothetical protein
LTGSVEVEKGLDIGSMDYSSSLFAAVVNDCPVNPQSLEYPYFYEHSGLIL